MGALSGLGLSDTEELVYEALVRISSGTIADLMTATGLERGTVTRAIGTLSADGLAVRSAGARSRLAAAPPEPAIDALIAARHEGLARARARAVELTAETAKRTEHRNPTDLVGVVAGVHGVSMQYAQMQRAAQNEVLVFDRPPYPSTAGVGINPLAAQTMARGVRYRTIYERSLLEEPALAGRIQRELTSGEHGRVLTGLPLKLAISDRSMAMLPLADENGPEGLVALVIRPSVLLDSLVALFEALWDRAVPLHPDASLASAAEGDPNLIRMTRLLAAGLKDVSIARNLGVTERTVRRKVAAVLDALGVETRFQAGMRAKDIGWI